MNPWNTESFRALVAQGKKVHLALVGLDGNAFVLMEVCE